MMELTGEGVNRRALANSAVAGVPALAEGKPLAGMLLAMEVVSLVEGEKILAARNPTSCHQILGAAG